MKSKTSFFNKGLSLSLLRRSWPVWTTYFVILLLMVPADLMTLAQSREYHTADSLIHLANSLNRHMLQAGVNTVILSFFACVLVAMAMYGFMYNSRSCSMYNSMPIRRETVFSTAFITGLVPMLIADIIIALICFVFLSGDGMIKAENIWLFLAMAVLGNICFFGFAAFCSVLTGNLFVLPAVYVVLNVAVLLAEAGINAALDSMVYGFAYPDWSLGFLSPVAQLANSMNVETVYERGLDGGMYDTGEYILHGLGTLGIYCVVGLVFAVFGLLLYRRRRMETVSDVVSIPVLKPIFKYCMCFGVGLTFAAAMYDMIFSRSFTGTKEAVCYLVLMLAGAFIGYFVSEMLMQKTLRVFRGKWKGFIISALIICIFIAAAEFDISGYEKRQPKLEDVESASFGYYDGGELYEEENIRAIYELHQMIIQSKDINENSDSPRRITLHYKLKDGSIFSRYYPISFDLSEKRDPNSVVNAISPIVNAKEAIVNRATTEVPATQYSIMDANFSAQRLREDGDWEHYPVQLSPKQAADFYNNCILPDANDCKVSRVFPVENEEYFTMATPVVFSFSVLNKSVEDWHHNYYDFTIYLDAQRCCRWIEENTDIELVSMAEYDPEGMEATFKELELGLPVSTKEAPVAAVMPAPHP